jgi:hypothetical protein
MALVDALLPVGAGAPIARSNQLTVDVGNLVIE